MYLPSFYVSLNWNQSNEQISPNNRTMMKQFNKECVKRTELHEGKRAGHLKVGELDKELLCPLPNAFLDEETLSHKCTSV